MKKLLTQQMVDAQSGDRFKRPPKKRDREKPKGEHPAGCLCRACDHETESGVQGES